MRMQNCIMILARDWQFLKKFNFYLPWDLDILLYPPHIERNESIHSYQDLHTDVCSKFICNIKKSDTNQIPLRVNK